MNEICGSEKPKPIKKLLSAAAAMLMLLAAALHADAREVIRTYDVDISINRDSSMIVTENITASVEHVEISRGIIRVFPVEYKNEQGRRIRVGFKVLEAKINGRPTKFKVSSGGHYKEVRIGAPDRGLERGDHTFTITYETTRQLGFFEEYDELYWNVTGNDWSFPILSVSCSVKLPDRDFGEGFDTIEWYSGHYGQKGRQTDAMLLPDGTVKTTRALNVGEGLTVAFTWPKGLVSPPPPPPADNFAGRISAGAITFILILAWLIFARHKTAAGQNEKAIIPLFHPPNGSSPAFTRYIHARVTDNVSLSAAIIGLAVKGALKILEKDGAITLIKEPETPKDLQPEEDSLLKRLFGSGTSSLELRQQGEGSKRLTNAKRGLIKHMDKSTGVIFDFTPLPILPTAALYALGAAALCFFSPESRVPALAASIAGGIMILIGIWKWEKPKGISSAVCAKKPFFKRGSVRFIGLITAIAIGHISVVVEEEGLRSGITRVLGVAGAALFTLLGHLLKSETLSPIILLLGSAGLIAFMGPKLFTYTKRGVDLVRDVEGLRLYMNTAEKDRLEMLNPPEETPQLFERLLPYALALGVAKTWGDRFANVLQNAQYVPVWYSGPSPHIFMDGGGLNSFSSNLERQIGSSIRSQIATSSSSSGSSRGGGRGFSGGGRGGGGGRGW